jgi:hypothetical protein
MTNKILFALFTYGLSGAFLFVAGKMADMTAIQVYVAIIFATLIHLNNYFLDSALMERDSAKQWKDWDGS